MGACSSTESGVSGDGGSADEVGLRVSKTIDKVLRNDEKRMAREVKVSDFVSCTLHVVHCVLVGSRSRTNIIRVAYFTVQMLLLGSVSSLRLHNMTP